MPKSERILGPEPGDLFRDPERLNASLDLDAAVRKSLSMALRRGSKSRQQVVEDMSRLMDRNVTVAMLNDFTAESKDTHRFPAAWLAAFVVSLKDPECLRLIVEEAGYRLISNDDAMLIDLARAYLARKEAAEAIANLEHRIPRGGR